MSGTQKSCSGWCENLKWMIMVWPGLITHVFLGTPGAYVLLTCGIDGTNMQYRKKERQQRQCNDLDLSISLDVTLTKTTCPTTVHTFMQKVSHYGYGFLRLGYRHQCKQKKKRSPERHNNKYLWLVLF